MDRLDDHSPTKWVINDEIQLAKFKIKILNANREREFPARARVSGASLVSPYPWKSWKVAELD